MDIKEICGTASEVVKATQPMLENLHFRWQDEHGYEDFDQYADAMKASVEKQGATFVKASKRPFGYTMVVSGREFAVSVTSRKIKLMLRPVGKSS